jgi:hypothetical protein
MLQAHGVFYGSSSFSNGLRRAPITSVTLTHPGFVAIGGTNSFTEDQLRVHADQLVFAINGMYRYQGWQNLNITPYIGGGPAFTSLDIGAIEVG